MFAINQYVNITNAIYLLARMYLANINLIKNYRFGPFNRMSN